MAIGFMYDGNLTHTNGNHYGLRLSMTGAVATGDASAIYMDMGASSTNKWAFSFQGAEVGHTAAGNGGFDSNSVGTFVASGYIKIKVGSDTRYIPYGTIS